MQRTLSAIAVAALVGGGLAVAAQAQTPTTPMPASPSTSPTAGSPAATSRIPGTAPSMNQDQNAGSPQDMTGAQAAAPSQDTIRLAQTQLKSQKLYRGPVDGVMGAGTRAAISRFQKANSLPETAQLDSATLQRLTGQSGGSGSSMPPMQSDQPSSSAASPGMTPSSPGTASPTGSGAHTGTH
jgi:peptidoglycan hydrolase-like protein with peptidoglycan-binding domain